MVKTAIKEALSGLVEDLRATHGTNLASVVLYGSAAAGDHIELRSDYNILIALNRITPEDLRQAQAPMRECRSILRSRNYRTQLMCFRSSFTRWPMRASFFTVTIRLSLHNFQTRICGIKLSMNSEAS
jgi:hypothetical protein